MSATARCIKCGKEFTVYVRNNKAYFRPHTRAKKNTVEVCPGSGMEVR
jgi:hypothetical protein